MGLDDIALEQTNMTEESNLDSPNYLTLLREMLKGQSLWPRSRSIRPSPIQYHIQRAVLIIMEQSGIDVASTNI